MPNKHLSTDVCTHTESVKQDSLSKWDEAIAEAKAKIKEFKQSIKLFESMKGSGMEFPEPKAQRKRQRAA